MNVVIWCSNYKWAFNLKIFFCQQIWLIYTKQMAKNTDFFLKKIILYFFNKSLEFHSYQIWYDHFNICVINLSIKLV